MSQNKMIDLDPKDFKLSDYDNVRITMPAKPEMTEEDVDAQLFEYVISGGKQIKSIADLDDEWVKANFEGFTTIAEVREAIKDQYDHDLEFEVSDLKFRLCSEALIARLEGDIPDELIEQNIATVRAGNLERLEQMHMRLDQYLREEHLTEDQYEKKVREETIYQMKMNVALDIMVDVLAMQVGNHEITDYLSTPNPKRFLEEIRENGQVEEARRAAVRVKAMRRIVDTAVVTEEGGKPKEEEKPKPAPVEDEDFVMPNFENMPKPVIKGENKWNVTVTE